jgi:hypothetical protein
MLKMSAGALAKVNTDIETLKHEIVIAQNASTTSESCSRYE